ncbi:TPM domain-containing protein [Proteus mirabilis]|nr:TPM domain-containing protein [Proteus mirabilis]MCU9597688.1 TPM domain-containing protein [Proteus mirabilis]MDF7301995.1 TPM domain-containing protein [Proteus mirabilis]MDF7428241.1 TPM domain-containing protein [Proteus mirabilis]MDM3590096.1 TPM domain-containing protein [Proteus mirabilis]MDM3763673.1 TPM domain-containing protein [Proteus mirabilis]
MIRKVLFLFSLFLFSFSVIVSASANDIPQLKTDRVIDSANLLTAQQFKALNTLLVNFENSRNDGSQFVVYIVPTTGKETIESFAFRVFNQWKIGRKGKDNGLLLVVAINDRNVRFEVGYGYEGALTDVLAGRIIRNEMLPFFRSNNYYAGIEQGVKNAIQAVNHEPISFTNSQINTNTLKIFHTHFILIYLVILGGVYWFQLIFSTRKIKTKINQLLAPRGRKKKNPADQKGKLSIKQRKQLKNYLQYSYYFPTFSTLFFPMTLCFAAAMFYTQVFLDGIIDNFVLVIIVILSLLCNFIVLVVLFGIINLLFPIYRQQRKEWKAICVASPFGSPFNQLPYSKRIRRRSGYSGSGGY